MSVFIRHTRFVAYIWVCLPRCYSYLPRNSLPRTGVYFRPSQTDLQKAFNAVNNCQTLDVLNFALGISGALPADSLHSINPNLQLPENLPYCRSTARITSAVGQYLGEYELQIPRRPDCCTTFRDDPRVLLYALALVVIHHFQPDCALHHPRHGLGNNVVQGFNLPPQHARTSLIVRFKSKVILGRTTIIIVTLSLTKLPEPADLPCHSIVSNSWIALAATLSFLQHPRFSILPPE